MNWDTDWKRAETLAWEELWLTDEDTPPNKNFAIRSALLAIAVHVIVIWAALC